MAGEIDLERMLATLTVSVRPGTFAMSSIDGAVPVGDGVAAVMLEDEGVTVVAETATAERNGWPYELEFNWLTLDVHSSLEAVGLTAAVAAVLTERAIPCNVIAAFYHDHLLVPADRCDEALAALGSLRS